MTHRGNLERNRQDRQRSEVILLQEIFPALPVESLVEILRSHEWDVDASTDAALALGVVHEENNREMPTWTTSRGVPGMSRGRQRPLSTSAKFLEDNPDGIPVFREVSSVLSGSSGSGPTTRTRNQQQQSVTSGLMSSEHQPGSYLSVTPMGVGSAQNSISPQSDGARTNRRTVTDYNSRKNPVIVLSDDLPGAPRFRITVRSYTESYTDFSILFNRKNSLLGLTLGTGADNPAAFDSEITVKEVTMPDSVDATYSADKTDISKSAREMHDITFHATEDDTSRDDEGCDSASMSDGPSAPVKRGPTVDRPGEHSSVPLSRRMKHLGYDAGVKVGDIILGVDDVRLSPGIGIAEVEKLLQRRPHHVTLHFRRRRDEWGVSTFHRLAALLLEQNIISEERADYVTKCLGRIKERVLAWDSGTVFEGDEVTPHESWGQGHGSNKRGSLANEMNLLGYSGTTAGFSNSEHDVYAPFNPRAPSPQSNAIGEGRLSLQMPTHGTGGQTKPAPIFLVTKDLRPALATRVLWAEEDAENGYVWYLVWVMDIKSGKEWTVRRRFSEFYLFREVLLGIRPSIRAIEFPPKRFGSTAADRATVLERQKLLHKFLRKTASLVCVNSLHPTTEAVHRALQDFLDLRPRIGVISSLDQMNASKDASSQAFLQVYLHAVTQMTIMDRILDTFLENFSKEGDAEAEREHYSLEYAREIMYDLRDFMDNLQKILFDGMQKDGEEVLKRIIELKKDKQQVEHELADMSGKRVSEESTPRSRLSSGMNEEDREEARRLLVSAYLGEDTSDENHLNDDDQGRGQSAGDRAQNSSSISISDSVISERGRLFERLLQRSSDDITVIVKDTLRRQVEIEVYVPCARRIHSVLEKAFHNLEHHLSRQVSMLKGLPQSFYGISVEFISPSSWENTVSALRDIRNFSIPSARLGHLVEVCKAIPTIYAMEHPESHIYLGADDFLPIFVYVLVSAALPNMLALHEEMLTFVSPERKMGEAGYYLATFEAAISHLRDINLDSGEGMFTRTSSHSSDTDSGSDSDDDSEETFVEVKE